jgi:hypothetical protein
VGKHFRVNGDMGVVAGARPGAVGYGMTCAFVLVRLAVWQALPAGVLRIRSDTDQPWALPALLRKNALGLAAHPAGLAQPDRAPARGQPSAEPAAGLVQLCRLRAGAW